jgi:hypothetical protein
VSFSEVVKAARGPVGGASRCVRYGALGSVEMINGIVGCLWRALIVSEVELTFVNVVRVRYGEDHSPTVIREDVGGIDRG